MPLRTALPFLAASEAVLLPHKIQCEDRPSSDRATCGRASLSSRSARSSDTNRSEGSERHQLRRDPDGTVVSTDWLGATPRVPRTACAFYWDWCKMRELFVICDEYKQGQTAETRGKTKVDLPGGRGVGQINARRLPELLDETAQEVPKRNTCVERECRSIGCTI